MSIVIEGPQTGCGAACEAIMRALPDWFGLEQSLLEMAGDAERGPTFLARLAPEAWEAPLDVASDDTPVATLVGFLTVRRHFPWSAEILAMGVLPAHHRSGLGSALVRAAERWLVAEGVEFLQVKTVGPSRDHEPYDRTRAFYFASGFRALEEMKTLWDERNPCLVLVKRIMSTSPPP